MRLVSSRESSCSHCGRRIVIGESCEWDRFWGSRCLPCAEARLYPERRNRRTEPCVRCGLTVAPRQGFVEPGEAGFVVRCEDARGCETRAELRQRDQQRASTRERERDELLEALLAHAGRRELEPVPAQAVETVLRPGGWPLADGRRACEVAVWCTADQRRWLVQYQGESDGSWRRPRERLSLLGASISAAEWHAFSAHS